MSESWLGTVHTQSHFIFSTDTVYIDYVFIIFVFICIVSQNGSIEKSLGMLAALIIGCLSIAYIALLFNREKYLRCACVSYTSTSTLTLTAISYAYDRVM